MAEPTLLDTMRVCGLDGDSWRAWRTLAKVMEAAPLDRDEQELFERCTARTRPPRERPAEVWVVKMRRTGGSRFGGAVGVHAARRSYPLAPGERAVVSCLAVDKSQARVLHGYSTAVFREQADLRGLAAPRTMFQALRSMVVRETAWQVDLRHGVSLEVHTADYRRIRGRSFAACIADEASHWMDAETGANPATAIFEAIRPGLTTLRGPLVVVTTPYAKRGPVWEAFEKYHGRDDDRVLVWRPPDARTMNPLLDQRMIDDAVERDPEGAASEWLGQFRDDATALIANAALRAVVIAGRGELERVPNVDYLGYCDTATGSGTDSHAFAVAHVEQEPDGKLIAVVDVAREWRPPFDPSVAVKECVEVCKAFGVELVHADRVGWGWIDAAFQREGIRYEPSPLTASQVYIAGVTLINTRQIELPDDARLVAQLAGLSRRAGQGGRDAVEHGRRGDDLANAAIGCAVVVHQLVSREASRPPAKVW